jgi:hypothetical protein
MARSNGRNLVRGGDVMPGSRSSGSMGLVALAALIAVIGVAGGSVAMSRTVAGDVPAPGTDGVRRLGESGVSVPVPEGWVDHRRAARGALLLEVEHRPIAGLFATRGLWVGRWRSADPASELERLTSSTEATWTDGPRIAGLASVVHEEVIGPPLVQRLPGAATMHRRELRVVAHGWVYQVGFWGPQPTLDDEVEHAVLSGVRIEAPPPFRLVHDGVGLTLPGSWSRGDCKKSACAFSPPVDGRPPDSWVYLVPWKVDSLDAGAQQLLDSLARQETSDLVHESIDIGGAPALRVRFAMAPKDTGAADFEDLLVRGHDGFVVVAMGWRTPEGRAQLDSVMMTLRL